MIIAGLAIKLLQRGFHDPAGGSLARREEIEYAIRVKAFKQPQLALARDLAGEQLRHADGPLGIIHPEAERVCREDRLDAGLGGQKGNLKPHAGQNTQLLSHRFQKPRDNGIGRRISHGKAKRGRLRALQQLIRRRVGKLVKILALFIEVVKGGKRDALLLKVFGSAMAASTQNKLFSAF